MFFKVMTSSPIGNFFAFGQRAAQSGDKDWFDSAAAINRLKASRVETSYLSRQSLMTSGSTRAQAAAFTRRASCSGSPASLNSPDMLASVSIFAIF
jgi:hypothetical protein